MGLFLWKASSEGSPGSQTSPWPIMHKKNKTELLHPGFSVI